MVVVVVFVDIVVVVVNIVAVTDHIIISCGQ